MNKDMHYGRSVNDIHQDHAYEHVQFAMEAGKLAGMRINHTSYSGASGSTYTTALDSSEPHAMPHMTVYSSEDDEHYGYTVHSGAPKVEGVGGAHKVSSNSLHG